MALQSEPEAAAAAAACAACPSPPRARDLAGRTALVTGATSGLGMAAAAELAARGAKVIFGVRNTAKAQRVAAAIRARLPGVELDLVLPPVVPPLDMSSPDSIRTFAAALLADTATPLDILLNNAGTSLLTGPAVNDDGVNNLVQVNYLSAYMLVRLLEPKLVKSKTRVVATSSVTHRCYAMPTNPRDFIHAVSPLVYPWTKGANVLFAYELQRRLGGFGVESCAVDPGGVRTAIWDHVSWLARPPARSLIEIVYAPAEDGAAVLVGAATAGPWEQDRPLDVIDPRDDLRFYARGAFASPPVTLIDGALPADVITSLPLSLLAPWRWSQLVKPALFGTCVLVSSGIDYPARHWSGGRIFNQVQACKSAAYTYNAMAAASLWKYSEELVDLRGPPPSRPPLLGAEGAYDARPHATPTRKRAVVSPMQTGAVASTGDTGCRRRVMAHARRGSVDDGEDQGASAEGEPDIGPVLGRMPPPEPLVHVATEYGIVLPPLPAAGDSSAHVTTTAPEPDAQAPTFAARAADSTSHERASPPQKRLHVDALHAPASGTAPPAAAGVEVVGAAAKLPHGGPGGKGKGKGKKKAGTR